MESSQEALECAGGLDGAGRGVQAEHPTTLASAAESATRRVVVAVRVQRHSDGVHRAICAKMGTRQNVGEAITILSPGLVKARSTCRITTCSPRPRSPPARRPTPTTRRDQRAATATAELRIRLAASMASIRAERTDGAAERDLVRDTPTGLNGAGQCTDGIGQLALRVDSVATAPLTARGARRSHPRCANATPSIPHIALSELPSEMAGPG